MRLRLLTLCLALFATTLHAQIQSPPASPGVTMKTSVGLTDVTLEYSRPGQKGRTLFAADGLVPYGEIWRTGANQATKITFSDSIRLGGKSVAAGSYAILTKPQADAWVVMIYPYAGGAWTNYVEMDPAATVKAKVTKTQDATETFTIDLQNYTMDGADLVMKWGNTAATLPITSNAKQSVMATIDRVMAGPSVNDYFQAATFLSETGANNEKALEYVQKAISMSSNPAYWMVRREAVILYDLGRKQEAVAAAKKSKELAQKAGNMDYVRMNEKSIEEWSK
ncbi:tetratricopeptide (TPR) repeat protein [Lewinella marina]|uniref:Dihydrolipoamide dehydrogenase n=1 Tax=Neolewinella marina TaxID=438751 RepID=A0A2G0CD08_9BACT|nr:DUF2911 domain-containing protein [Neolewinella marina]NJB86941.1 tetratricopeptide (TPR) repeat protein [Neolewinella marina]PHK97863.1 dihydrolipoamide dehydrogenase [Neolewinella marina]